MMSFEHVLTPQGTDINAWMHPIQASIPRTVIVNLEQLGLTRGQVKRESGLGILCRLMADKVYGRKAAPVPHDVLEVIKPLIDPSIIVMAPHHMVKRLFALSDEDLTVLRTEEIVEYQQINSTFVYHWDMLRSEWLGGTFKCICH